MVTLYKEGSRNLRASFACLTSASNPIDISRIITSIRLPTSAWDLAATIAMRNSSFWTLSRSDTNNVAQKTCHDYAKPTILLVHK